MPALICSALRRAWLPCAIAILACATWLIYAPGLHGTFVFDDFASLPAIGANGPIHDAASLLRYVTSSKADPTGRPLATLSFLLDAHDWPASAYSFKRTNLLIHAVNGLLLAWFLIRLGEAMGQPAQRARMGALLAASLWLFSPLLVSTVLYVVQREAMLATTCMLLAGLCWIHARNLAGIRPKRAVAWLTAGVGGCTVLALLCKANGAVIPLLVLACECALPAPADIRFRRRATVLLGIPSAALLAGLAWLALSRLGDGVIPSRGWSVGQRLLTEPTILWEYLAQLWLVAPTNTSVLHDGMPAASSLFSPWQTLPAILGCVALLVFACITRRRFPALALAIVFFFAGHVMESTSIPLELYFEHRNYLPALLIFWPIALAITRLPKPWHVALAMATLVLASGFLARQNALLWGDPYRQALVWAAAGPDSARSQAYAAQVAEAHGRHDIAERIMESAMVRFRDEPQIALANIDIQCQGQELHARDIAYANDALRHATREPGAMLLTWFRNAIATAHAGTCPGLTPAAVLGLLDAANANPAIHDVAGRRQDLHHARGLMALSDGDVETAARWFDTALSDLPGPATALSQAALLGSAGRPDLGLAQLDRFGKMPPVPLPHWSEGMARLHAILLARQEYWPREIEHLRKALRDTPRPVAP